MCRRSPSDLLGFVKTYVWTTSIETNPSIVRGLGCSNQPRRRSSVKSCNERSMIRQIPRSFGAPTRPFKRREKRNLRSSAGRLRLIRLLARLPEGNSSQSTKADGRRDPWICLPLGRAFVGNRVRQSSVSPRMKGHDRCAGCLPHSEESFFTDSRRKQTRKLIGTKS